MKNIASLFNKAADINKTQIAVKDSSAYFTYEQVEKWATALAKYIYSEIGHKKIIATILPAGIEYIVGILAINKSGNSFFPIDRKHPKQIISKLINHAGPAIILTNINSANHVPDSIDFSILALKIESNNISIKRHTDDCWLELCGEENSETDIFNIEVEGISDGYLINTSGTTGEPKTIVGRNESLCHFIQWQIHQFNLSGIRVAMCTSIGFDVSLRDIFTPLIGGGTLVIPDEDICENIVKLISWIREERIELLHLVPSVFRLLTSELAGPIASLKYVFLAGEPLYWKDVYNWESRCSNNTQLVNLYGPSETTLAKLFYVIPAERNNLLDLNQIVPLGQPLPDTQVYVLRDGKITIEGEKGEIHIATLYGSNRYLKREEQYRGKFKKIVLSNNKEVVAYRTGDEGYFNNGLLNYSGRLDRQIKIAGNRVEPLEIQAVLLEFAGVTEAYVLIDERDKLNYKIIAFYIADRLQESEVVLNYLKNSLPNYMIPHFIYQLNELPLNINGKVDSGKLMDYYQQENQERYSVIGEIYADDLYGKVYSIIERTVSNSFPDENKTLMQLGVSSLKAIQILANLYKEFRTQIPLAFLLSNNAKSISYYIKEHVPDSAIVSRNKEEFKDYYASPTQTLMLFASYLNRRSNIAYNVLLSYKVSGCFQEKKLIDFVQNLLTCNEIFRTSYHFSDDSIVNQNINPIPTVTNVYKKVYVKPEEVNEFIDKELNTEFDLIKDNCLLKVILLEVTKNEYILIFKTHHITVDVHSLQLMQGRFINYYANGISDLYNWKLQYKAFTQAYNIFLTQNEMEKSKHFWMNKFRNRIEFQLPTDFERPKYRSFLGLNEETYLEDELTKRIFSYLQDNNCSLFMFYSCVLSILFWRYSGSREIVFGIPMTLRDFGETYNDTIGFFMNTLPVTVNIYEDITFKQFLKDQVSNFIDFYKNKYYPFPYIVENLDYKQDINKNPLFNYMIAGFEQIKENEVAQLDAGTTLKLYRENDTTSKFDLSFFIINTEGRLKLQIEYDTSLYRQETILFFLNQLKSALSEIISNPDLSLCGISFKNYPFGCKTYVNNSHQLPEQEQLQMSNDINKQEFPYSNSELESRLFAIWKTIPMLKDFSMTDNFFDIGGTSMKAISLITRINDEFTVNFTILDLFIYPNIKAFSEFMQKKNKDDLLQVGFEGGLEQMEKTLHLLNAKNNE